MGSQSRVQHRGSALAAEARPYRARATSLGYLVGACGLATALAFAGLPIYGLLQALLPTQDAVLQGLEFSAFYLALGLGVGLWHPYRCGLIAARSLREWRLVAVLLALVCGVTLAYLLLAGPTPYSGKAWPNEVLVVPLSEEVLFRGVLYGLLATGLSRLHATPTAWRMAVVYSALAFGVAHSANLLTNPAPFTALYLKLGGSPLDWETRWGVQPPDRRW